MSQDCKRPREARGATSLLQSCPNLIRVDSVAWLIQFASSKQQQQRLTKVTTLDDQTIALYTYDENDLRLTKTVGDTTHEYLYN